MLIQYAFNNMTKLFIPLRQRNKHFFIINSMPDNWQYTIEQINCFP